MGEPDGPLELASDALKRLDPVLQHRLRLGALVLLAEVDRMSFSRLKELLAATDGNLGAQLRKLEEAGYVSVRKQFVQRRPVSWYALRAAGRRALQVHLGAMQAIVQGGTKGR
jgi:DNA-binding transcriptional ArsR family regulator